MLKGHYLSFIVDRLQIVIFVEEPTQSHKRQATLTVDNVERGVMTIFSHIEPSISVGRDNVAIWTGVVLYLYYIATGELRLSTQLTEIDEVHEAFWGDGYLLLVCEISIVLLSMPDKNEIDRYDYNEIIVSSQWMGDTLVVEDFQGYQAKFKVEGGTLQQLSEWQLAT